MDRTKEITSSKESICEDGEGFVRISFQVR